MIQYAGLSEINGPLVCLEGAKGVSYDEIAEIKLEDGTKRLGRVVEMQGDKVVLQVFEGTNGISLTIQKSALRESRLRFRFLPKCSAEHSTAQASRSTDLVKFFRRNTAI